MNLRQWCRAVDASNRGSKIVHPKHGVGRVWGYAGPGLYSVRYASGHEGRHYGKVIEKYYKPERKLEQLRRASVYGIAKDSDIEKLLPFIPMS